MSEDKKMARKTCNVCHRGCSLSEGEIGACKGRLFLDGEIKSRNYGVLTSLALDPIEKKPLRRFFPGSNILSLGSFGCNMFCGFCQNHDISRSDGRDLETREYTPREILSIAMRAREEDNNIGVAFTYNEPLIGFEFVRDTARLISEAKMKNVVVTNGCISLSVLSEIAPNIDAMNIDLKSFNDETYKKLGGDLDTVKLFIKNAAKSSHIELTTLIVPNLNDSKDEMENEAQWIASIDRDIPLHITRYFPRYKFVSPPTDIEILKTLAEIAKSHLKYVYIGNV